MEYSLLLAFLNSTGTKSSITISDVKEYITAEEVKALYNKMYISGLLFLATIFN